MKCLIMRASLLLLLVLLIVPTFIAQPGCAQSPDQSSKAYTEKYDAGMNALQQGHWLDAKKAFEDARVEAEKEGPESRALADTLQKLGETALRIGQMPTAEENLKKSLDMQEKLKYPEATICSAGLSLAQVYEQEYKFDAAEPLFERALKQAQSPGGNADSIPTISFGLATVYLTQNKFALAEPLYKQAITALDKKVKNSKDKAYIKQENIVLSNCLHNLSVCMIKNGHPKDAVAVEERSKKLMLAP